MLDIANTHASTAGIRREEGSGMHEPGIFKGCRGVDGPLPGATKDAILAYLGKPNAAAWERLRRHAIVGRATLGDAWAMAHPTVMRRFPTSIELIRAMRKAVIAEWASGAGDVLKTH